MITCRTGSARSGFEATQGHAHYTVPGHSFTQAVFPAANQPKQKISGMTVHALQRLGEAIQFFQG